jgi:preprotein translocase subunit SecY
MKVYDGGSSHLPIKVNPAGVIPAIFASSLLLLPTTISTFSGGRPTRSCRLAGWPISAYGQPLHLVFFWRDDRVLHLFLHPERRRSRSMTWPRT